MSCRIVVVATLLTLALSIQAAEPAKPAVEPGGRFVPAKADRSSVAVRMPETHDPSSKTREFRVNYALDSTAVYIFPTFAITSKKLFVGLKGQDLFDNNDQLTKLDTNVKDVRVAVQIMDVQNDPVLAREIRNELRAALDSQYARKTFHTPAFHRDEMTAALVFYDPEGGGKPTVLAEAAFPDRGQHLQTVHFSVRGAALDSLKRADKDSLGIVLTGRFDGELEQTEIEVRSLLVAESLKRVTNDFVSHPSGNKADVILSVPDDGQLRGGLSVKDALRSLINVDIRVRRGTDVPAGFIRDVTTMLLSDVKEESMNLRTMDQDKMTAFLVGNQIKMTAPLGKIADIEKEVKKLDEEGLQKRLEDYRQNKLQKGETWWGKDSVNIGAVVEAVPVSVGASFEGGGSRDRKSESTEWSKEDASRLMKALSEIRQRMEGNLPVLTGMRVSQVLETEANALSEKNVKYASFKFGYSTLDVPLPFDKGYGPIVLDELQKIRLKIPQVVIRESAHGSTVESPDGKPDGWQVIVAPRYEIGEANRALGNVMLWTKWVPEKKGWVPHFQSHFIDGKTPKDKDLQCYVILVKTPSQ